MIKICFLKNDINGGGTERVTSIIANNLVKNGQDFEVFVLDIVNPEKIQMYNLDKSIRHHSLTKKSYGKISVLFNNYYLYKFLKKNNIDILINVQAMMGLNSILPTLVTKTKNVVWEHANYYQKQGTKTIDIIRQIELLIGSYYIVLTKKDKNNFKNNFICRSPIDYIYNPMPNYKNKHAYNDESKIIMSAGHLSKIKGFDLLLEVAAVVLKKHEGWKWHIYGEGSERSILEGKIKELQLEEKVILCGRTQNIEEIFKNAAMFVLTSRMEGLPMVLLEARANHLPIISFDIETGPNEIISDRLNGYLIKPYDINEMAEKISLLINDQSLRKDFSNYINIEESQFSINEILKKWNQIIYKIND